MAQVAGASHNCNKCGARVVKAITNAGKTYTANVNIWRGDMGGGKTILSGHQCHAKDVENWSALRQIALDEGQLIFGQEVVTVKGRKVAVGTTGVIFWTEIDNGFAYGDGKVTRVGFKDAQGNAHFTAATNVVATNQLKEAK